MDRDTLNAFWVVELSREIFLADSFVHAHAYVSCNEVWENNTLQSEDNTLQNRNAISY